MAAPEAFPYPGTPERWRRQSLRFVFSRNGEQLEFSKTLDLQNPRTRGSDIDLRRGGVGVSIPLWVFEDMGQGDIETGMAVLADAVAGLDYNPNRYHYILSSERDPLFERVIFPYYGGLEAYFARVSE